MGRWDMVWIARKSNGGMSLIHHFTEPPSLMDMGRKVEYVRYIRESKERVEDMDPMAVLRNVLMNECYAW